MYQYGKADRHIDRCSNHPRPLSFCVMMCFKSHTFSPHCTKIYVHCLIFNTIFLRAPEILALPLDSEHGPAARNVSTKVLRSDTVNVSGRAACQGSLFISLYLSRIIASADNPPSVRSVPRYSLQLLDSVVVLALMKQLAQILDTVRPNLDVAELD